MTSHRPSNLAPYDANARRLFATLAKHLVRAVGIQRRTHQLDITGRAALAGLDELDQGFALVDAQARPVFINRRGRELLQTGDGVVVEAGALGAVNAEDSRHLRALIGSCSLDNPDRMGGEMNLRRPPGRMPLHVQVTPVGREWTESTIPFVSGWRSSVMVLMTDPEPGARAQFEALRERYGLTRAEAAFALEIVNGGGRRATAERLGITDGTARSHLSKIFDKTGVSRQAELVRLLMQKQPK